MSQRTRGIERFVYPKSDADWHALRQQHVGASEVAALFGLQKPYQMSRYTLWQVKAGRVPPPVVDNPRAEAGLRFERAIAEWAADVHGWSIRKAGYARSARVPGMGATCDFLVAAGTDRTGRKHGPGVLEVKNVDWLVFRRSWDSEDEAEAEPPPHILLQLQQQLGCTDRGWGAVAAMVGGNDPRTYRYEARPKVIESIEIMIADFWQSIRENRPPPADGSDGASGALAALLPGMIDEPLLDLRGDNEAPGLAQQFLDASKRKAAAEAEYKEARNRLREKMAGHKRAMIAGFWLNASATAEKPASVITPEMIGQEIGGRAAAWRLTVKEHK
jgi:predicted phage-related endonuclease